MKHTIQFIIALLSLNYFSGKANMKDLAHRAMDVGLTINHVSQDGSISQEDKDAIVQEIIELSDVVIKFLDDIELPK